MQGFLALLGSEVLRALSEKQDHEWLSRSETHFAGISCNAQFPGSETDNEGSELPAKLKK